MWKGAQCFVPTTRASFEHDADFLRALQGFNSDTKRAKPPKQLLGVGRILGRILAVRLGMLGDVSDQGACASWGTK